MAVRRKMCVAVKSNFVSCPMQRYNTAFVENGEMLGRAPKQPGRDVMSAAGADVLEHSRAIGRGRLGNVVEGEADHRRISDELPPSPAKVAAHS